MNSIEDPVTAEIDDNAPIPGTVFNKRQARLLKYLVITMGLMLLFGFALMIGIIAYRASQPATSIESIAPPGVSVPQTTNPVKALAIASPKTMRKIEGLIPRGASYLDSTISGNRLILTLQTRDKGLKLILIDLASWQIIGDANLAPNR